ncbi:MAG: TRAP transporter small permease [Burkholderiaceae bacterium]|nr:TRAP transporter small permease [Burkholderiaceae bacterium]
MAWLHRLEEWLIAALLAVMTLVAFGQVIARYVFNYSFVWALELVTFLFAWLIFLGAAYGVRVHAHIGVDAFVQILGRRAGQVCGALAAALCIVYSVIVVVASWTYVGKMYSIGILAQDLPIEQWIPRTVMVIGFGILVARFSQLLYKILTGQEQGMLLANEAANALKLAATESDEQYKGKKGDGEVRS